MSPYARRPQPVKRPARRSASHLAHGASSRHPSNWRTIPTELAMRVRVLFFGRLKEIVGSPEDAVELPPGTRIEELFDRYRATFPELVRFRPSLVASRNQEFAPWNESLEPGDEVAFLPPVSGG